jgi:hypothetical protein
MKIPVFVSSPTSLNKNQDRTYKAILDLLDSLNLERRALGRSDYPTELPLKEVIHLAKRCSGGLILGFIQQVALETILKPNTNEEKKLETTCHLTPWNQLEAGILFGLKLPILVFKEDGIQGGIFDHGVSDVFIHKMPTEDECKSTTSPFREVILKWQSLVRSHYYSDL